MLNSSSNNSSNSCSKDMEQQQGRKDSQCQGHPAQVWRDARLLCQCVLLHASKSVHWASSAQGVCGKAAGTAADQAYACEGTNRHPEIRLLCVCVFVDTCPVLQARLEATWAAGRASSRPGCRHQAVSRHSTGADRGLQAGRGTSSVYWKGSAVLQPPPPQQHQSAAAGAAHVWCKVCKVCGRRNLVFCRLVVLSVSSFCFHTST